MRPAPLAIATAFGFGQPSRGPTIRIRVSPKFSIARAAAADILAHLRAH
jgi:hypothetical protein